MQICHYSVSAEYSVRIFGRILCRNRVSVGYYFLENWTSRRPFLLLRISFPGRPIFIQIVPELLAVAEDEVHVLVERLELADEGARVLQDDAHPVVDVLGQLVVAVHHHFE